MNTNSDPAAEDETKSNGTTTTTTPESSQPKMSVTPQLTEEKAEGAATPIESNPIQLSKSLNSIITINTTDNNNTPSNANGNICTAPSSKKSSKVFKSPKIHPAPLASFLSQQTRTQHDQVVPIPSIAVKSKETLCLLKTVVPIHSVGSHHGSIEDLIDDINNSKDAVVVNNEMMLMVDVGDEEDGSSRVLRCSDSDSMEGFCRICHDNPSKLSLIAPCSCKGSMGLVHRTCLERWLGESGKQNCEICNTEFITQRRPRYTGLRSVCQWIKSPTTPNDARNLFFDLACFLILTPLAAISAYLCVVGAQEYVAMKMVIMQDNELAVGFGGGNPGGVHYRNNHIGGGIGARRSSKGLWRHDSAANDPANTTWTSVGLLTLTGTLLAAYYVWLFVAFRYHVQIWREWQRHNYVVTIMPASSVSPSRQQRQDTIPNAGNAGGGLRYTLSQLLGRSLNRQSTNNNNNNNNNNASNNTLSSGGEQQQQPNANGVVCKCCSLSLLNEYQEETLFPSPSLVEQEDHSSSFSGSASPRSIHKAGSSNSNSPHENIDGLSSWKEDETTKNTLTTLLSSSSSTSSPALISPACPPDSPESMPGPSNNNANIETETS